MPLIRFNGTLEFFLKKGWWKTKEMIKIWKKQKDSSEDQEKLKILDDQNPKTEEEPLERKREREWDEKQTRVTKMAMYNKE